MVCGVDGTDFSSSSDALGGGDLKELFIVVDLIDLSSSFSSNFSVWSISLDEFCSSASGSATSFVCVAFMTSDEDSINSIIGGTINFCGSIIAETINFFDVSLPSSDSDDEPKISAFFLFLIVISSSISWSCFE